RRGEPARGGAVPDEPARRGSAHGRAVGSDAKATARAAYSAQSAAEELAARDRFARRPIHTLSGHVRTKSELIFSQSSQEVIQAFHRLSTEGAARRRPCRHARS